MAELLDKVFGFVDNQSRIIREGYQSVLDGLGFLESGGQVTEPKKVLNALNLSEEVGVFNLKRPQTRLAGNATEMNLKKQATVDNDCYIEGVAFIAESVMGSTPLLKVGRAGRAVITNCLFFRGSRGGNASFVDVVDGGTVVFNGCGFISTSTVQNGVSLGSSPVANGIRFVGCSKGSSVTNYGVVAADIVGCI